MGRQAEAITALAVKRLPVNTSARPVLTWVATTNSLSRLSRGQPLEINLTGHKLLQWIESERVALVR